MLSNRWTNHPAEPESAALAEALAVADAAWARSFGTGSRLEMGTRLRDALTQARAVDPAGACAADCAVAIERAQRARYGSRALSAEAADERERDAARCDDMALARYEKKWATRLDKLFRAHPERWHLAGLSDEELRDELTLRLIEAIRSKPEELSRHCRAGKEWGLAFLSHERRLLRSGFRLNVVLADLSPVLDRAPTEEEQLIELQNDGLRRLAATHAERSLSRPQRRWLSAMKLSANAGAFFESSGRLNLAAASRLLDKHRSSALRAFDELRRHYGRELDKLGPGEP